jgi:hypothetical protein
MPINRPTHSSTWPVRSPKATEPALGAPKANHVPIDRVRDNVLIIRLTWVGAEHNHSATPAENPYRGGQTDSDHHPSVMPRALMGYQTTTAGPGNARPAV